jgi:hypothetical protein
MSFEKYESFLNGYPASETLTEIRIFNQDIIPEWRSKYVDYDAGVFHVQFLASLIANNSSA